MSNSTNILSKMPLLQSLEILDNAHVFIVVSIALGILLWYVPKFEGDQILKDVLQKRHKQHLKRLEKKSSKKAAAPKAEQPSTPHAHQKFRHLNPIQSVERQQRKRSESTAALIAANDAAAAAATPRLCQNFRRLNPEQSVERHRRIRSNTEMDVNPEDLPHFPVLDTNEIKL